MTDDSDDVDPENPRPRGHYSAIHVNDVIETGANPLVIIDGDVNKAKPFIKAISGLRTEIPSTAHCLQSEYYYPSALLADLSASHLARSIENGDYNWAEPLCHVQDAKRNRADHWGKAFNGLFGNSAEYEPAQLPNQRGNSVKERICCWCEGSVMPHHGVESPVTDSLNPIVQRLRQGGFENLAEILAEL